MRYENIRYPKETVMKTTNHNPRRDATIRLNLSDLLNVGSFLIVAAATVACFALAR